MKKQISLRMDDSMYVYINKKAKENDCSMNSIVLQCIRKRMNKDVEKEDPGRGRKDI